jgi:hypothetical protein
MVLLSGTVLRGRGLSIKRHPDSSISTVSIDPLCS